MMIQLSGGSQWIDYLLPDGMIPCLVVLLLLIRRRRNDHPDGRIRVARVKEMRVRVQILRQITAPHNRPHWNEAIRCGGGVVLLQ